MGAAQSCSAATDGSVTLSLTRSLPIREMDLQIECHRAVEFGFVDYQIVTPWKEVETVSSCDTGGMGTDPLVVERSRAHNTDNQFPRLNGNVLNAD